MEKRMRCDTCNENMEHLVRDLYRCKFCELISSSLDADLTLYDKSYLRKYEQYEKNEIGEELNSARANFVQTYSPSKELSLLDFGCGSGGFVRYCEYLGIKAAGFDINPHSQFCDITNLLNGHKIVTFWDSIEHLKNPKTVIKGLNPDYLFISTPSTDDFKGKIKELTGWHHYYPNEHVHYYNEKSLLRLFDLCGFTVLFVSYKESKLRTSGGSKNILTIGGVRG